MPIDIQAIRNVTTNYGVRKLNPEYGGEIDEKVIKVVQWTFSYNKLPTFGVDKLEAYVPANATILSAKLQIIEAFTSTSTTTDLTAGLYTSAGVAISAAGLITAAQADQTAIAVVGSVIDGASGTAAALINKTVGAVAGELVVAASVADLLTGRARLIVTYINKGLTAK